MGSDASARDAYSESQGSMYKRCILSETGAMAQREAFSRETPDGEPLEALQLDTDIRTMAMFEYIRHLPNRFKKSPRVFQNCADAYEIARRKHTSTGELSAQLG